MQMKHPPLTWRYKAATTRPPDRPGTLLISQLITKTWTCVKGRHQVHSTMQSETKFRSQTFLNMQIDSAAFKSPSSQLPTDPTSWKLGSWNLNISPFFLFLCCTWLPDSIDPFRSNARSSLISACRWASNWIVRSHQSADHLQGDSRPAHIFLPFPRNKFQLNYLERSFDVGKAIQPPLHTFTKLMTVAVDRDWKLTYPTVNLRTRTVNFSPNKFKLPTHLTRHLIEV